MSASTTQPHSPRLSAFSFTLVLQQKQQRHHLSPWQSLPQFDIRPSTKQFSTHLVSSFIQKRELGRRRERGGRRESEFGGQELIRNLALMTVANLTRLTYQAGLTIRSASTSTTVWWESGIKFVCTSCGRSVSNVDRLCSRGFGLIARRVPTQLADGRG